MFSKTLPIVILLGLLLGHAATTHAQESTEFDGIRPIAARSGYRKNWALLIGINYTGLQEKLRNDPDPLNRRALPKLENAANDAKSLAKTLKDLYFYEESTVKVLTDDGNDEGDMPTDANIRAELTKLCDPEQVASEDSVMIFFAGHGFKLNEDSTLSGNAVALLPCDVEFSQGRPYGTKTFDLPTGFYELVERIPAKHKLIILDCCYSGEIFNARGSVRFQAGGGSADRSDRVLQQEPTFQAIASCRATQKASDGRDGNSKFTTALLDGLKHIPARSDGDERVWANRLLGYMRPQFDESQRPDCRNLIRSTGEFCFYPRSKEKFADYALNEVEKSHLKAMVVSRQGNWWFQEMPWFIPGIRSEIVQAHEKSQPMLRSASFSDLIQVEELKETAELLMKNSSVSGDEVRALRYRHAKELLQARDAKKVRETLEGIEKELLAIYKPIVTDSSKLMEPLRSLGGGEKGVEQPSGRLLEPEDIHFLAVVQHALGNKSDAEETYTRAIMAYSSLKSDDENKLLSSSQILMALCHADRGELRLSALREPQKAISDFQSARKIASSVAANGSQTQDSTALFNIFMLCSEADACLAMNRWTQANSLLSKATDLAEALAPNHFLQAHVYRRQAWAQIIQWDIQEAKSSFQRSNKILYAQFLREAAERGESAIPQIKETLSQSTDSELMSKADDPKTYSELVNDAKAESILSVERRLNGTNSTNNQPLELGSVFRESSDHASKIAYLHNLHGIAMATRFSGDTLGAASYYRWLTSEVEDATTRYWDSTAKSDLERLFVTRIINTQERLGDCNLFGIPTDADANEAYDDYRRAMNRVHLLRDEERERTQAALFYKQALALSLPSPVQDTELAMQMCQRADIIYTKQREKATDLLQALGELTTKIVGLHHATSDPQMTEMEKNEAAKMLRQGIMEYRDVVGRSPHRDQLELCLFASKALLENGGPQDKFQVLADADLLLSFCRLALTPYSQNDNKFCDDAKTYASESRAYLRPYYDAVMRVKLKFPVKHVKDMLEIQAEATLGTRYVKTKNAKPILATYLLDNEYYLLMDLPQGASRCVLLTELYDLEEIRKAIHVSEGSLPLPRDVHKSLVDWCGRFMLPTELPIELRWEDPGHGISEARTLVETAARSNKKINSVPPKFPFALPDGVIKANTSCETSREEISAASK